MKDIFVDVEKLKQGLYALEDTTKAPFGSARIMRNVMVTDRGGIAPRPGTELLGSENSNSNGIRGLYNFKRSFARDELLVKAYDDELEVYSKNYASAGWFRLKDGFTANKEFGFTSSLVNVDNQDYLIFCNQYEPYQRWTGVVTLLDGALSGGETNVQVDSLLTDEIFESKTATANSATTLDVSGTPWAASQWVNMYLYIPSTGKIRKITSNTTSQITFDTLGAGPGNVAFQIRRLAFPATGTIIYNGTTIAYTAPDVYNKFPVSSAHAASDNAPVALVPTEYAGAPRGNRLTNYLSRVIVGNVRSALARDSGGALQGYAAGGSYFVSKITNPFDFTFSASRAAGEGDIIGTPYGGGEITDVSHQEDAAYIFKQNYIESVKYSQDSNDLATREPLKAEVGSVGRVIKGSDDIYFITPDGQFTSIGRVSSKDSTPQTQNIGLKIKRVLEEYDFSFGRGCEFGDRVYIPGKSDPDNTNNDIVLVYNKGSKAFDGIWDISANFIERFNKKLYFGDSSSANVYQMLTTSYADVAGTTRFAISCDYATNFANLTASKGYQQAMNSAFFEGYIKGNSTIMFKAWKDFATSPFLEFSFSGTETSLLDGQELPGFLGGQPLGLSPMGSISEPDEEGRRHFLFRVYFPFQYGNFFSIGFSSAGADYDYEVTRFGLGLAESPAVDINRVKSI